MRSVLKRALLFLSLFTAIAGPAAKAEMDDDYGGTVLVSPEQGEALAAFALQSERRVHPKPDCSHLVHLLYARAGLIYRYEDSRVLYRGISDFERMKTPQPGDLVVWLGHVGIVLSPEEKTFLSSVRSGIHTESWTAAHWARRGRPRFYRYRIGPAANMNLLAAIMFDETRVLGDTRGDARSSSTSAQLPFPDGQPTVATVDNDGLQAGRGESLQQDSVTGSPEHEAGTGSDSIVAMIAQRQTPNKRQISVAFAGSSTVRARRLIAGERLDLSNPFSVFDRVEVEKINIRHESGWITLRLSETLSQEAGKISPGKTMERVLSIFRRNDGVWVISDPQDRTYLAQENALEIFERQAEIFLRLVPNSSNTRTVVKALDLLYDKQ
ncbi:MAG TPA: NlpC/P60 family protein, partial [Candidatus Dormibacteraeota bacterium]|nr:NlpC/P60 family protein [Candidatus Dormibacteraeota bacterium]